MNDKKRTYLFKHLFEVILSIPKSIWFNFKVLPFSKAIKLPYIVSYHVKTIGVNKRNFITNAQKLKFACSRIGFGDSKSGYRESPKSLICIENGGTIIVGNNLGLSKGVTFVVNKAKLILGNHFRCNYSTTIECQNSNIVIGDDVVFGWNVVLKNYDGHYIEEEGMLKSNSNEINIGNHVWVCAFSTLLKGIRLGDNCVVAYGSLLTKCDGKNNMLYGGHPAKVLRTDIDWKE